jgi:hypothetical protein
MAFNNYYIKVGSYTIPLDYMKVESYTSMPDQRQDLDSYRDADGYLHRTVLSHTATKIEFETTHLWRWQMQELIQGIKANLTSNLERKCTVTYYDDEIDDYKTGTFYLPGTMEYKVFNKQIYAPTRFAFIEY